MAPEPLSASTAGSAGLPRVAVVGVGAIGGVITAALHTAGHCDLTCFARGACLKKLQKDGLSLACPRAEGSPEPVRFRPRVLDSTKTATEATPQDVVIVATKASQVPIECLKPLLDENTMVVMAMNGVPFWFFHKFGGEGLEGSQLRSVDADGQLWDIITPQRAIGCVVFISADIRGEYDQWVSCYPKKNTLIIGEPDGRGDRCQRLAELFDGADPRCPVRVVCSTDIRAAVFDKLIMNITLNPLTALTRASMAEVVQDPGLQRLLIRLLAEGKAITEKLGIRLERDAAGIVALCNSLYAPTSMSTDVLLARPLETDPIIGVFVELGQLLGVATPTADALLAMLNMLEVKCCGSPTPSVLEKRAALQKSIVP